MKPDWLKVKIPSGNEFSKVKNILKNHHLHTVCSEASCPNVAECYNKGTATFIILGDICTRNCMYCNIKSGKPTVIDTSEPKRISLAVKELNLEYVVITSVTRDDLKDGGASHFVQTISEIKKTNPKCKIEVLIPDFNGKKDSIKKIIDAKPYTINHNIETTKALFTKIRPQGNYHLSLQILKQINNNNNNNNKILTKSGFMIGLGETTKEINETINDLKNSKIDILTIGQYLQPRRDLLPVLKYYTPEEFKDLEIYAKNVGIKKVMSGPLVRSSYHAEKI